MEKRITKRDYFNMLGDLATKNGRQDLVDFINHEIELLDRKGASKTETARQVENNNLKEVIVNTLNSLDNMVTINELQALNSDLAELSNQRMTSLLTQLVRENRITRKVIKGKAYFGKN